MMIPRIAPLFPALLALVLRAAAQGGTREPVERLGLDIVGSESPKLTAPGAPAAPFGAADKRAKGPTEITAREAMFDNNLHLATFAGDVLVRDPEFGLSSDQLTVYLKKPAMPGAEKPDAKPKAAGEQGSGIEKALADGNVVITQQKIDPATNKKQLYTGKGERAVFDNATGTLTLYGWPQISQTIAGSLSKQILSREKSCVITLNRSGKIEVKGYHTSTLQDAADLAPAPR